MIDGKKSSDSVRICTDLSALNQNIVVDSHPLPIMEELVYSMSGAKVFSILDLNLPTIKSRPHMITKT